MLFSTVIQDDTLFREKWGIKQSVNKIVAFPLGEANIFCCRDYKILAEVVSELSMIVFNNSYVGQKGP